MRYLEPLIRYGHALLLLALAALFAWDHLAWIASSPLPMLGADSPVHCLRMVATWFWSREHPQLSHLLPPGYYPPAATWAAFPLFAFYGPSIEAMRQSQVLFTALLVLGSGILATRCWGRPAGLAAAALSLTFPHLWQQRTELMLELPLAGMTAMAFALLPSPAAPGRPFRAALAGVVMALALLTHQKMLFFAASAAAWQLGAALVGLLRRREDPAARRHLLEILGCYVLAGALASIWYVPSLPFLTGIVGTVRAENPTSLGLAGVLFFVGWLKHGFLYAPHAWAMLLGLLVLPRVARAAPLVGPVLAAMLGGFAGLLSFPQAHERYFLALAPLMLTIMLAPLGWLGRPGRLEAARRALLALLVVGLMAYGITFTVSWRWPAWGAGQGRGQLTDGAFGPFQRSKDTGLLLRRIVSRPKLFAWFAPLPPGASWPMGEVVARIVSDAALPPLEEVATWIRPGPKPGGLPVFSLEDRLFPSDLLNVEALTRREPRLDFRWSSIEDLEALAARAGGGGGSSEPTGARGPGPLPDPATGETCRESPCYVIAVTPAGLEAGFRSRLEALGFTPLERWPAWLPSHRDQVITLAKRHVTGS